MNEPMMRNPMDPTNGSERSLLIVEDNDRFAETLGSELRDRGYIVQRARDLAEVDTIKNLDVDFAVVDLRLGADSGLDAIQKILVRCPKARIVVLTGYGSIATAVKATKHGAVG
jgi:two-component system response regulator RegA